MHRQTPVANDGAHAAPTCAGQAGRRRKIVSPLASYLAAFGLAFAVILASFASLGIYPFGDLSVMLYDMPVQYVNYFGWLIEALHGEADVLYSNAAGLGGGTLSLFTYYLSSPFNLIAFFFTPDAVPQLFSLLYLLKIPTCALCCLFFLRARLLAADAETWAEARAAAAGAPAQSQAALVLVSCAYALTSYVVGYASNIMWLDGVYMLPLAAAGVWRLVQRKSCCGLFVAAAAAILFNWYTGYMVCLFCAIYFLYEVARARDLKGRRLRLCARFAITLGLAVGAGVVVLLPTALSLLGGKGESAGISSLFAGDLLSRSPLYVLNLFGIGITPGITTSANRPALVVSALALVGCAFLFANPSVSRRSRISAAALLIVMLASVVITPVTTIWSGFVAESSYINRNGFAILFTICFLAAEGLVALPRSPKPVKSALASGGAVAVLYLASAFAWRRASGSWLPSASLVALEAALIVTFTALGALAAYASSRRDQAHKAPTGATKLASKLFGGTKALCVAGVCLFVVFSAEQLRATELQLAPCQYTASDYAQDICELEDFYAPLHQAEDDGKFVRIGNTSVYWGASKYNGPDNMALALGLSTFDHYTSTQETSIQELLEHLGYSKVTPFGTYYMSPNTVADALLGVTYIADDAQPYATTPVEGADALRETYRLYRNDLALPLGWGCLGSGDVSWSADPFANQQDMLADAAGAQADIWNAASVAEAGAGSGGPAREITVTANEDGPLYAYFPTLMVSELYYDGGIPCEVSVDGTFVQSVGGRGSCNAVYLGEFSKGQAITLSVLPKNSGACQIRPDGSIATVGTQLYEPAAEALVSAKTLKADALQSQLKRIDSAGFTLKAYQNGKVEATFDATSDEKLVLSVPYEDGWSATVNGQAACVEPAYGGLMALSVQAGENDIELTYRTPGLDTGVAISAACVTLFGVWRLIARKRKVSKNNAKQEGRASA